jgi:hypothetical protein
MSKTKVEKILKENSETFTRSEKTKPIIRKKWDAKSVGEIVHADIFFLKYTKTTHAGRNPVLIVVDVYSRYIWLFKQKKKSEIKPFIEKVIKDIHEVIGEEKTVKFLTDAGKEFSSLKNIKYVNHIISKSKFKAAIAEANIRHVKELITKIKNSNPRGKLDFEKISKNLNTTQKEQNNKTKPEDIFNGDKIPLKIEHPKEEEKERYSKKDIVRLNRKTNLSEKQLFEKKSQMLNYSKQIFKIIDYDYYNGIYTYTIQDIGKTTPEPRQYYYNDLQKIDISFLRKYK